MLIKKITNNLSNKSWTLRSHFCSVNWKSIVVVPVEVLKRSGNQDNYTWLKIR